MLQTTCIGYLGADAEAKNENGKEFVAFRIANTDKWTDDAGNVHEETTWVDCIMNGRPAVFEYLKRGTQVFVTGSTRLRVYSSTKDRCMKAGLTISVRNVELLGGKSDPVPSQLIDTQTGAMVAVDKWFHAAQMVRDESQPEDVILLAKNNAQFHCSRGGWVTPFAPNE